MALAPDVKNSDPFDLTGKVAIVTGSSRGIGKSIAEAFAGRGARVVISSRDADACEAAAASIRANGGDAFAHAAHIGKREQLVALVDTTLERFGRIDTIVANAAVNPYYGPMSSIADDAYDRIMNSNVRSTLWLANLAFPHIAAGGGGSAIFLSSVVGLTGSSKIGAYAVSKTALIGLARSLAVEWGPSKIRVNCIAPGIVKTDFAKALWDNPDVADPAVARTSLKRLADPDDIAGAAVFLAAPASAYVTGQALVVDGGLTIDAGM